MPYFQEDKNDAEATTGINRRFLAGAKPIHNDPNLPKNLGESIALEGEVFQEISREINQLLAKKGEQKQVASLMSEASAIVDSIDDIVQLKANLGKSKT